MLAKKAGRFEITKNFDSHPGSIQTIGSTDPQFSVISVQEIEAPDEECLLRGSESSRSADHQK